MTAAVCTIRGVEKAFGPNQVLRDIALDLPQGQVTVLMGANGAGKSTLVKILCGVHEADAGEIVLFGEPFRPASPADAYDKGVVTVHQSIDDGVIPDLDVASNLLLDRLTEPSSSYFLNDAAMRRDAREIAASMRIEVDVRTPVSSLGIADRQMIAIARAMARNPKLMILDEPTSSLSANEAERLFELIDRLKESGVSVLYISHRMSDIRRIADRIVSMRDGRISGVFETEPLDYEGAVTAMLGHAMTEVNLTPRAGAETVLDLQGLRLSADGAPIDFVVRRGEVLAITGLLGSGKTRLAATLFGEMPAEAGTMKLEGKPYAPASVRDAIRAGVFLCPKDRASNAVIPDFDITGNITVPFLKRHAALSLLRPSGMKAAADAMIETLGIVCQSDRDDIGTLSGGNQQKVMVARWLYQPSQLLVLDEPFQGVDIKARRDIGRHIRETADARATIVFVAELDEALEIADRILVLHEQALVGEHVNADVDLAALLAQVSGRSEANQPVGAA